MRRLLGVMFVVVGVATTAAQTDKPRIVVKYHGQERAGFVPLDKPYLDRGPSVSVYLVDRQDVRLSDGVVVTGFHFIGWSEGDATRVQVFALVPSKDAPNTYMPNGKSELLQRRDFASYRVTAGQPVAVGEMMALNVEPMELSVQTP